MTDRSDEIERLRENEHHANGVAELAMKHRDVAEAEIERLKHKLEEHATAMEGWRGALAYRDDRIQYLERRLKDADAEIEQLRSDLELRSQTALDRKNIIRQLEAEIERLRQREGYPPLNAEIAELEAKIERLRALLADKEYIRCLADYNDGHLSHANYLESREKP